MTPFVRRTIDTVAITANAGPSHKRIGKLLAHLAVHRVANHQHSMGVRTFRQNAEIDIACNIHRRSRSKFRLKRRCPIKDERAFARPVACRVGAVGRRAADANLVKVNFELIEIGHAPSKFLISEIGNRYSTNPTRVIIWTINRVTTSGIVNIGLCHHSDSAGQGQEDSQAKS